METVMEKKIINRREFFKAAAGGGLAAAMTSGIGFAADANSPADANKPIKTALPKVPTRPLGKAKIPVPVLSLGVMFDATESQILLYKGNGLGRKLLGHSARLCGRQKRTRHRNVLCQKSGKTQRRIFGYKGVRRKRFASHAQTDCRHRSRE
jgi:hypothetical protein